MGNRSSSKSQSFDVSEYPIFYFAQILYRWDANLAIEFESQGLDHSDWRMLGALQYRDAQTIKELARLISFDPSFISRLAARLEKRGLVDRCSSDDDRRNTRVTITDQGRQLCARVLVPIVRANLSRAFEGVSAKDMEITMSVLKKAWINVYAAVREIPPAL